MIVSHSHKFIFIHARKVAGSSMKVAIAPHLSGDDIVIGSLNEIMAAGIAPPPAIKQILSQPKSLGIAIGARLSGKKWPEARNIAVKRHFSRALGVNPPHPTAERAASFVGDVWASYTKFCFVRNPWTRVVSDYYWRQRSISRKFSFEAYLEALAGNRRDPHLAHPGNVSNWDMMAIDGKLGMDHVGRFENIDEDFRVITKKLGLPPLALKTAEKAAGKKPDYEALYTPNCRKMVEKMFAQELETFTYEWPF